MGFRDRGSREECDGGVESRSGNELGLIMGRKEQERRGREAVLLLSGMSGVRRRENGGKRDEGGYK